MFNFMEKTHSIIAESYRMLRSNILYSSFDNENKVILFTSAQPKEGKSITCLNLAMSLSTDYKKVIVVDCDLRRPTVHKKLKISNSTGLSELLIGKAEINDVIQSVNNNLDVITCGKIPPNPSEMLGSNNMKILIEELKEHYDYIVIDTAPVLAVTDAQVLSRIVDGVIVVVKANYTTSDMVKEVQNRLEAVKAKILGTILNGAERNLKSYHYYS